MEESVIILQPTDDEARQVANNLQSEFKVFGFSSERDKIFMLVERHKPDFLITSLILKNGDGIDVIEKVKLISPKTIIILLTMVTNPENIKDKIGNIISYYMVKPANYAVLKERMHELYKARLKNNGNVSAICGNEVLAERDDEDQERKMDEKISRISLGIGIPPHIKGYIYIREGIKLAVKNPDIINSVTKKLYPAIGKKFKTSASKVERAIRHAIEVAWNKGKIENFNALFEVHAYSENEKPTNSEFIALIADRLLLDGFPNNYNVK